MARPPKWHNTLVAAKAEAALAVRLYNDAAEARSFEGFVVHMHVAWLYLLHARFIRDGVEFRYRDRAMPHRFAKVDGEHKRWELGRCLEQRWPDAEDSVRKNIEFFGALRNKIEHRHAHSDANLALALSGHSQAHLLNFEEELVATFGAAESLASLLRFPVFIGSFTEDGTSTLKRLRDKLPADLKRFIADFHDGLTDAQVADSRFELRLRVVLEQVQRGGDELSIQFTRWDDLTDEQKVAVKQLGREGKTIVREQKRSVVGHGLLKPGEAERRVADAVPFVFNSNHFLRARKLKKIRPESNDPHPERTTETYCIYSEFSKEYGYTEAWVKWLIKNCSTKEKFEKTTGRKAVSKP